MATSAQEVLGVGRTAAARMVEGCGQLLLLGRGQVEAQVAGLGVVLG